MGMNWGDVFAQGIIGGAMGAGKGIEMNAQEEIKRESERIKEERISKLRMGEYQQQLNMKTAQEEKDRARTGAAATAIDAKVAGSEAPQTGEEVDESGQPIGVIEGARKLSPREQAAARVREAQAKGEKDLVTQYEKQSSDLISEQRADRQDTREEQRNRNESERNALAAREGDRRAEADRMRDKQADRRHEALLAGILGREKKGEIADKKYSDKQWSDAKKDLTSTFFSTDEMGKDTPDHTARAAASAAMRTIQSAGSGVDPVDAANAVGSIVSRVAAAAKAEAKGDPTKYQKYLNAGVDVEVNKALNGKATKAAPASAPATASQAEPPSFGNVSGGGGTADDATRLNAQFDKETREIETGVRTDYSPEIKAWMDRRSSQGRAAFNAGDASAMQAEQARLLRKPVY